MHVTLNGNVFTWMVTLQDFVHPELTGMSTDLSYVTLYHAYHGLKQKGFKKPNVNKQIETFEIPWLFFDLPYYTPSFNELTW